MVDNEEAASAQRGDSLVTSIEFSKCLLFLETKLTAAHERENKTCTMKSSCNAVLEDGPDFDENKLCFVQWYELLDCQNLAADLVDKVFGCVWSCWQRTSRKSEVLFTGEEFGLIPIDNIKNIVLIVAKDPYIFMIDDD